MFVCVLRSVIALRLFAFRCCFFFFGFAVESAAPVHESLDILNAILLLAEDTLYFMQE